MRLSQNLSTKQIMKLQQILSPKMIQMLKTFHYSYADLSQKVQAEAEDNSALEIIQYDQLTEYAKNRKTSASDTVADVADYAADLSSGQNLYDYLTHQLDYLYLGQKEHAIALKLIENLDERGYLTDYDDVKEMIKSTYQVKDRKVGDILKLIQTLEPEGVGARTVKECLLVQLEHHQFQNDQLKSVLKLVIQQHLDDLGAGLHEKIAKKLGLETEGVLAVSEFIKQNLTPNPAEGFQTHGFSEIVIPSFEVYLENDSLKIVHLEQEKGIQVGVSQQYLMMLEDPNIDNETREFVEEKIKKAKELVELIEKRRKNLQKLAEHILSKQIRFIKKGSAFLEPLLQKDISIFLGVSPSTVSRIVSSKYVQTPHGIISFKELCPRSHFGKTAERLKIIVQELIKDNFEFSDQEIANLMKSDGIDIARRTVNKYRHL
jgi:RNA polymerase sigma-54 factor